MQKEAKLQEAVCNYIRLAYPKCLFKSDLSGIKLTIGQAVKLKKLRSNRAFLDLEILEPNLENNYSALYIELKVEGTKLFNKKLELASSHLKEQYDMILELRKRGYCAEFACGFDEAKELIDMYLLNRKW